MIHEIIKMMIAYVIGFMIGGFVFGALAKQRITKLENKISELKIVSKLDVAANRFLLRAPLGETKKRCKYIHACMERYRVDSDLTELEKRNYQRIKNKKLTEIKNE